VLYGKYILFPTIILQIGLLFFLCVSYPESFVYSCDYGPHEPPKTSKGVYFYGIQLHEPFEVPQLDKISCDKKKNLTKRINLIGGAAIILLIATFLYKHKKKLVEVFNNDRL